MDSSGQVSRGTEGSTVRSLGVQPLVRGPLSCSSGQTIKLIRGAFWSHGSSTTTHTVLQYQPRCGLKGKQQDNVNGSFQKKTRIRRTLSRRKICFHDDDDDGDNDNDDDDDDDDEKYNNHLSSTSRS